ncbi:MAG: hypothetical protein M1818_007741 [Claussenomyces sp. TS43310]|nr:MAG: hypothetical protein M1818_007741 [Claussenomyces sp. TS43310]
MPTVNVGPQCSEQLQDVADVLAKSKKVVVVTGAGISTNCGIPDFRSENGLYALIQAQHDVAASAQSSSDFPDSRPSKRRKLDRSISNGTLEADTLTERLPLKRQLRSSQSFNGLNTSSLDQPVFAHQDLSAPTPILDSQEMTVQISTPPPETEDSLSSSQASSSGRQSLPNLKGKDLFDSIIWTDALATSIFYTFIASLRQKILQDVKSTTKTHRFIKVLRDGGRLVRNYTQNIDGLEAREGLCVDLEKGTGSRSRFSSKAQKEPRPESIDGTGRGAHDSGVECVHLHGSLDSLRCGLCARLSSWDEDDRHQQTLAGAAPECPWCAQNNAKREGRGRRSLAIGRLRPDIVLYGEEHPLAHLVAPLITYDLSLGPDVLLILGTSLRVHGLKIMVKEFAKAVHGRGGKVVFVNMSKPPESVWGDIIDVWIEWDCDAWVEDLEERRKELWLPQGAQCEEKVEKVKAPAKNPKATRPDAESGAYFTRKILDRLALISGRALEAQESKSKSGDNAVDDPQQLCDAQLTQNMLSQLGVKRKREYRPSSVRPNKENGAFLVHHIAANLRRICQGATVRSQIASKDRQPLTPLSSNISCRRRAKTKKKLSSVIDSRQLQLPTPPTSDEAPSSPMTPKSQRIKRMSSISAILSSPLSEGRQVRVWRDG